METERLKIHIATDEEMVYFIEEQDNEILKIAYSQMLDGCRNHPEQWEWYAIWMIELRDGTHIGELSFKGLNKDGSVEVGYGICEAYQGFGYATEAVSAVVKWALSQPSVCCVYAETFADNTASKRVLEKCGFISTGTFGEEGPRYKIC